MAATTIVKRPLPTGVGLYCDIHVTKPTHPKRPESTDAI